MFSEHHQEAQEGWEWWKRSHILSAKISHRERRGEPRARRQRRVTAQNPGRHLCTRMSWVRGSCEAFHLFLLSVIKDCSRAGEGRE